MKDNKMLNTIISILQDKNIEILNIANEKENGCLLSFLYKNNHCYITSEGGLYLDKLDGEDENFIKKIIIYAQRKANIDKTIPIQNIDEEKLELRIIDNFAYRLLIQIKNQCLFYRANGIFGIDYMLCEQRKAGSGYQYKNIAHYSDIRIVEQNLANRTSLYIKPMNLFSNDELKTILYFIENTNEEKSKNFNEIVKKIKRTIIDILKEGKNG